MGAAAGHAHCWAQWRRFLLLGLLSTSGYNALLYLALNTSTPINCDPRCGASTPVWMLLMGRLFFGAVIQPRQLLGTLLSMSGVVLVLSRGDWSFLMQVRLVAGDAYMLLAAAIWAYYSWMLTEQNKEPASIRSNWAAFLMAQIAFGLLWSALFAGAEWALTDAQIQWGWPLIGALLFVAAGPALLAYRCWGAAVQQAGPTTGGLFCQPDTAVRGVAVGHIVGGNAAHVPCCGICNDCIWDHAVIAPIN